MKITAIENCWEQHMADIGLTVQADPAMAGQALVSTGGKEPVCLRIAGSSPLRMDQESAVQAATGLMHMYGLREGAGPRRLGLPYASVNTAVMAAQGVYASLIGQARGSTRGSTLTMNPGAGILLGQSHHVELAEEGTNVEAYGIGEPPPFRTQDGHLIEIETLKPERWDAFWRRLGADRRDVGRAWQAHETRQWTACFRAPESLHRAAFRPLAYIQAVAERAGVCIMQLDGGIADQLTEPWANAPSPTRRRTMPHRESRISPKWLPLYGMTVVEASHFLQGPYAGRVLALLGAQVVRLEPPAGDPARGIEPVVNGCSVSFRALHRGKATLNVDLTNTHDRHLVHELIADADVFVTNWSPGLLGRTHLDYTTLHHVNPSLVYGQASGGMPDAEGWPHTATDWSIQAASGMARALRPEEEDPAVSQMTLLDPLGGMLCAEGVLAALLHREDSGQGGLVETSLRHAARLLMSFPYVRGGPLFHPLPTEDGYLAVDDSPQLRALLDMSESSDRLAFTQVLASKPAAEWEKELTEAGAVATHARSMAEVLCDPPDTNWLRFHRGIQAELPWRMS